MLPETVPLHASLALLLPPAIQADFMTRTGLNADPVLLFCGAATPVSLFAARYAETGSLANSSFLHALSGCWLFTIGLGQFFHHGAIASVGSALRR